jgi:hypothetical protein
LLCLDQGRKNIYPHHDLSYGLRVPRKSWNGFQTRFHLGTGIIALIANAFIGAAVEGRKHLSRIKQTLGVEGAFQPLLLVQIDLGKHLAHAVALLDADAMLARKHAAEIDAAAQDVGAERLRLLDLARLVGVMEDQPVQIAVAGMEDVGNARLLVGWRILVRPKARYL